MNQKLTIGGVVLAVLLSLSALFTGGTDTIREITTQQPVGAVSSPDIQSPYFSYGGVRHWAAHTDSLTAATTTPCILVSPAATSTLNFASIQLTTSTTTAYTVTIATSSAAVYATTTPLAAKSGAAGSLFDFGYVATSTFQGGSGFMAPNTLLVMSMTGGVGTFSPVGHCQASWTEI